MLAFILRGNAFVVLVCMHACMYVDIASCEASGIRRVSCIVRLNRAALCHVFKLH